MSVQSDLYNGIFEVFSEFFGEVTYYPFDEENSKPDDIYGESLHNEYLSPVGLLAKPAPINFVDNPIPCNDPNKTISFVVPTKAIDLVGLPTNTHYLDKGLFYFNGTMYKVLSIVANLGIQNKYLTYQFMCEEDTRRDYNEYISTEDRGLE